MTSMWKRTLVYLGLDDDEDGFEEAYAPDAAAEARRVPEQGQAVRPLSADSGGFAGPVGGVTAGPIGGQRPTVVRTMPSTAARVHVVEPRGFEEAQEVGDRLKVNQPVIINLQGLTRDLQRRMIDFSSGLTYALSGSMQRVAEQVFLLTPSNVEVSQEEKERLQARGLFNG